MKKDKNNFKENLLEGLLELIFSLIFFGIGALLLRLFGVEIDSPKLDFELITLIGILALVFLAIIFSLVKWIKDKRKKKDNEQDPSPSP